MTKSDIYCQYLKQSTEGDVLKSKDPFQRAKNNEAVTIFGKTVDHWYALVKCNPDFGAIPLNLESLFFIFIVD